MSLGGLYVQRDSIIHSLDARVKFAWFLLAFAASVACQWDGSLSVFVYLSLIFGLALARIPIRRAFAIIAYSIVLLVATMVVWASMYQDEGRYLFTLPLAEVRITDVGLLVALGKFFLIVNPITAFILLVSTTRFYDIIQVLSILRLPYKAGFLLIFSLGLLPYVFAEFRNVMDVQRARGIDIDSRNPVKRIMYTIPVFVPVIIRTMSYVWDISIVLLIRGFGYSGKRTFYFPLRWTRRDTVALAILASYYLAIVALRLAGFSTYYFIVG